MKKTTCVFLGAANFLFMICFLAVIAGGNSTFIDEHSIKQLVMLLLSLTLNLIFFGQYIAFLSEKLEDKSRLKITATGFISVLVFLFFLIGEQTIRDVLVIIIIIDFCIFILSMAHLLSKEIPHNIFSRNSIL